MTPNLSLFALSVGLVSCTTGWGKSSLPPEPTGPLVAKLTTNQCPPELDVAGLAHAALGVEPQPKVKELRILAWKESAREHEANNYVDEALIWIETESDGFVIAYVGGLHDDYSSWHTSEGPGNPPAPGAVTMAAAPTHDQFERFLNKSSWTWTGLETFKLMSSSVCEDTWTKTFGQPSGHKFTPDAP